MMQSLKSMRSLPGLQKILRKTPLCSICFRQIYNIVTPGIVSPALSVPEHIQRPSYIVDNFLNRLIRQKRKIERKTPKQMQSMEEACLIARDLLLAVEEFTKVGVTTDEIDRYAHKLAIDNNCYPSPLHYKGFPKSVCTSVNNVACHGIPDDRALENGDIINVDITVYHNSYHGDTSATFLVGDVDEDGRYLVEMARECRDAAILACGPGQPLAVIGNTISKVANAAGLGIVAEFCGHGIGEYFHGPPDVIHVSNNNKGVMEEGMIFTVEPVITEGDPAITILSDGWTAVSKDERRSAQFEHTVLITSHGCRVLT